jgi:hypothetical protein
VFREQRHVRSRAQIEGTLDKMNAMNRRLAWIETQRFRGWGCSECTWVFNPSGSPFGHSLDEMIQNYEEQRDQEFASHDCSEHPRAP